MNKTASGINTQGPGNTFGLEQFPEIEIIEMEIFKSLADSKGTVRDMCTHILSAGGKRIRPLLVLYCGMSFSGLSGELLQAAAAAELIHMASLVHDDIIDDSDMRRTRLSVNKIWGRQFAVLCGDYLFSKAFEILSRNRLIDSMDYMVAAIQNMCQGEILQADDYFKQRSDIGKYYEVISKKTAKFIEYCCKSGAAAAGASEQQIQLMGEFGLNLGMAFQIIDDILDYTGDINVMGKPNGEDLKQGIFTLPVIILQQDTRYSDWIGSIITGRDFSEPIIAQVINTVKNSGIIDKCNAIAASYIEKSRKCLDMLPLSKYTQTLYHITDMLQVRVL